MQNNTQSTNPTEVKTTVNDQKTNRFQHSEQHLLYYMPSFAQRHMNTAPKYSCDTDTTTWTIERLVNGC